MKRVGLSGEHNLALAVLWQAVKDIRNEGSPNRAERTDAVVFLASKRATAWFDVCGMEQRPALQRLEWSKYAQALLDDPTHEAQCTTTELTEPQRRVLKKGVALLVR